VNLSDHNFHPDKFYKDHWVSALGNVCTRLEAERIVKLRLDSAQAKVDANLPLPARVTRGEMRRQGFEVMREAV